MKRDSTGLKEDELLTMMEEIQGENEGLQEENTELRGENKSLRDQASEAQQTISRLSSENSILRNAIQKKSETIVSLNAQIGSLSASDLVLKQNEQLERQNRELRVSEKRARQEAAAIVSEILYLLVSALLVGTVLVILFIMAIAYIRFIQQNQADELSVFVAVIDLACVLFMADEIKQAGSINLLLLMILIFLTYSVTRGVLEMKNKEVRNKLLLDAGIIVGFAGGVIIMIRFLGPWSLLGIVVVSAFFGNTN